MTTRYFYPQDVKIEIIDGKRVARLDFSLPTKWCERSKALAEKDYITGWELARRNYEDDLFKRYLAKGDIAVEFWAAHRVENYDPMNPRCTVSEWDIETEDILNWAKAQALAGNNKLKQLLAAYSGDDL